MEIQMLNVTDKFSQKHKFKNTISFWAFLLSVFMYISVFYVSNLSPLALFNTTKFWFFISNTLILIIVADFGVFSSTQKHASSSESESPKMRELQYLHLEGPLPDPKSLMRGELVPYQDQHKSPTLQETYIFSSPVTQFKNHNLIPDTVNEPYQLCRHMCSDGAGCFLKTQEEVKKAILVQKNESHHKESQIIEEGDDETDANEQNNGRYRHVDYKQAQAVDAEEENARKLRRSQSEADGVVSCFLEEGEKVQRSRSERYEYGVEDNDFSDMSDEELNRRVEEFIQKFYTNIRLQAARNHHNLHEEETI